MTTLKQWLKKPSMNKLVVTMAIAFATLFWFAWQDYAELSALPLAWLVSTSLCTMFYLVDRIGFSKVDTITILNRNEVIYALYMCIYAGLVGFGHWLALSVFSR